MSSLDPETLSPRRKRARFRAWHRGMREMDLILGRFADTHLAQLDDSDLAEFEAILEILDRDLFQWIMGEKPTPAAFDTPLFARIRQTAAESAGAAR